jgi:hypothetical protein
VADPFDRLIEDLRGTAVPPEAAGHSDAQLLARYVRPKCKPEPSEGRS